jgi:hypothetical protein
MSDKIKGFVINEEGRQHINLSTDAMIVIEGDMIKFNNDYTLSNKSGFMNTIISNYYDSYPLSKRVALKQLETLYKSLKQDDLGRKVVQAVVDEFSQEIMKNIINEYSNKYPSEIQFKIKLNKENINILENLEEYQYFHEFAPRSGVSFYIKMILESYAVLKREERERIYFKETIEKIERAIVRKSLIKFKYEGVITKVTPMYIYKPQNQQSLEVYVMFNDGIMSDQESVMMDGLKIKYLKENDLRDLKEKAVSRLQPTKEIIKLMKNLITEKENTSKKPTLEFKIKFTNSGLNRYIIEEDNIPIVGIQDPADENIVTFKTTETKIFHHLFKFGAQAQILSPIDARERFMKLYKVSYLVYSEEIREA